MIEKVKKTSEHIHSKGFLPPLDEEMRINFFFFLSRKDFFFSVPVSQQVPVKSSRFLKRFPKNKFRLLDVGGIFSCLIYDN